MDEDSLRLRHVNGAEKAEVHPEGQTGGAEPDIVNNGRDSILFALPKTFCKVRFTC